MTELLYMQDFDVTSCKAVVIRLEEHEGQQVVVLDQSCFYPKGGGQDFDLGTMSTDKVEFVVGGVFFVDGEVKHIGSYNKGTFAVGDDVRCEVDTARRKLNTRLHSAGHVLDMAVRALGWEWTPGKGAHYPHMSFVEYSGELDSDQKEVLKDTLQSKIDELIEKGSNNTIKFMGPEEMTALGAVVPENLPKGKPSRAVLYNDFAVPCGGTHVQDINEIGKLTITKIKMKDGNIRVSYALV